MIGWIGQVITQVEHETQEGAHGSLGQEQILTGQCLAISNLQVWFNPKDFSAGLPALSPTKK